MMFTEGKELIPILDASPKPGTTVLSSGLGERPSSMR